MGDESVERRLAAILAADVVGYSRLVGLDEEGTLAALKALRKSLIDPTVAKHRGRIVKNTGDGALVEFASAVDAVRCAVETQRAMADRAINIPEDGRIEFRIGINIGDIVIEEGDIFGDGVNIAVRLESIAAPGGVCLSEDVYRQVRGKFDATFEDIGEQKLKNIVQPVRVYRVRIGGSAGAPTGEHPANLPLPDKPSIAVLAFQNMSGDVEQEHLLTGLLRTLSLPCPNRAGFSSSRAIRASPTRTGVST
jgi:adenylate cyclase